MGVWVVEGILTDLLQTLGANNPLAKGHDRYDKHARGRSEFDTGAEEGEPGESPKNHLPSHLERSIDADIRNAGVAPPPDEDTLNTQRDQKVGENINQV